MPVKLKVCGMRDNIDEVARLQPDYLGFIFYKESPRYVGDSFMLNAEQNMTAEHVGVFVNESTQQIIALCQKNEITTIQLHGDESVEQCSELKSRGYRVIKAFSIGDKVDFEKSREYEQSVDYFLFDAKGKFFGGNGVAFNWSQLQHYRGTIPFFLSGGLSPANAREALAVQHPLFYALDVNSGVEMRPGLKDTAKVADLRAAVIDHNLRIK